MNNLPEGNASANGPRFHERCRTPHRATRNQFTCIRAHALGCRARFGRTFSSRLFSRPFLFVPARAALGNADFGFRLFADGERQHQRNRPQLHSQPVLPLQNSEPPFWSYAISRLLLLTDLLRRGPHAAPQRQFRSAGRKWRHDRLVVDLPPRPRRRGRKSVALCIPQFLPRRCRCDSSGTAQTREWRRLLGEPRAGFVRDPSPDHVFLQLAIRDLLYGSVLVSRSLLQLFERLLSPLRRESG